jgi:Fe-S-cluster containining protein
MAMDANRPEDVKSDLLPVIRRRSGPVPCLECGQCCRYVAVGIDAPTSIRAASEIVWHLYHENVSVYRDADDEWVVQFEARCRNLQDDNKCAIYEHRPQICRDHSEISCEVNSADDEGITFVRAEEFIAYLERRHKRVFRALVRKGLLREPSSSA